METKIILKDSEIPKTWYNIMADMPNPPAAVLHPGTGKPITPDDLAPLFPMALIEQEVATQRFIPIPDEVRKIYSLWRPSPMYRAKRLEQAIRTRSRIYFKHEGVSPAGSHKPNTAIPQAYYNKMAGRKRIATETGAGQWGSALALGTSFFGLECKVYMVKVSYYQKPYRRMLMEVFGAKVVPSPSEDTQCGRQILASDPDSPGSLGIAISEAVEDAATREDTSYSLGSVLNHVLLHQTVIGLECQEQMKIANDYPDVIIGCVGGGSNMSGLAFPFLRDKIAGSRNLRVIAVEPASCPTLTKGVYAYDFGDTARLTPLVKMYTLGHDFVPAGIHAGGLRYHGDSPLVSQLCHEGLIEAQAYHQTGVFQSALVFARAEGILPAPETAHAIHSAIVEAKRADEEGKERAILFNLSGHGFLDLAAYDDFLAGKLVDHEHPESQIREALSRLPKVGT
ncbi:MAG TPA: TrpB-like pyridoxal phosphate-dependent enzyme [Candidatus Deferrimicrobiaceae bacterium]|nr:TrpB-like pyridoxal phosphate-dependent enzyme [Candidatus Deferrimicrobiaceae bacterium]